MLGLGETRNEIREVLTDMREHGVDALTIGQYMRPTKRHLSIKRWVPPEEFAEIRGEALAMGYRLVAAGPLVRSSFRAGELFDGADITERTDG